MLTQHMPQIRNKARNLIIASQLTHAGFQASVDDHACQSIQDLRSYIDLQIMRYMRELTTAPTQMHKRHDGLNFANWQIVQPSAGHICRYNSAECITAFIFTSSCLLTVQILQLNLAIRIHSNVQKCPMDILHLLYL